MKNLKVVDARNLSCPQPVILARQAINECNEVIVIVDNDTALENVKRLALKMHCTVKMKKKQGGDYELRLLKKICRSRQAARERIISRQDTTGDTEPFIIVLSADKMGRGNDELGGVLMKAFIHTIGEQENKPSAMILYNTAVQLAVEDSDVLDDLKKLTEGGVEIMVCGTCLNYFNIKDQLAVGVVSNMYDIVEMMSRAGKLIVP